MKTKHLHLSAAAALTLALALPATAQQQGKSKTEKALDTAVKILDILGGNQTAQGGKNVPALNSKAMAEQSRTFAGAYQGNGIQGSIQNSGPACFVQLVDQQGTYNALAMPADGYLAASFSQERSGGVNVYRVQGGVLRGTGMSYSADGKSVGLGTETLEGSPNMDGIYRITSATNTAGGAYTGSCLIRKTGDNNYHLTWTIGREQYFGMGFLMANNLWVAWSPTQNFFLTVFERAAGDPQTLVRHTLINNGKGPTPLAEMRLINAPAVAVNNGKVGFAPAMNGPAKKPAPAVVNKPAAGFAPARQYPGGAIPAGGGGKFAPVMNNPAGRGAPAGQQLVDPPGAGGARVAGAAPGVPAKGPQVDKTQAAQQLRQDWDRKVAEFMKLHNDARAEVGVPPLQWDDNLAAYAQEWADKLGASGNMQHRPNGKYGENLAGYLPQYGERPVHGAKMWYDEIKDYKGGKMGDEPFEKIGHYTQMVWRKSTRVGFGVAMTKNGMVMLCANYDPAGNMMGEHPYRDNGAQAGNPGGAGGIGGGGAAPAMAPAGAPPPGQGLEKPIGGAPAPDAPVVAGIGLQLAKDWTNTRDGNVISSVSPDGTAGVFLKPIPSSDWDGVQGEMANHLASILPGLTNLAEVSTEHDVFRDGVGLRVVTYTGVLNGANTRIVVDFARQGNVDDNGLLLIVRFGDEGADANWAKAQQVAESLRLKK